MTEAGKDGGFSFKNLFKKGAASVLVGGTVLTSGGGVAEAAKFKESFEVPKSTNEAFVKTEDTTANVIENGQINLHMTDEQALAGLKQQTNEIKTDSLTAQMGANTSEKPTINWQKTDEQAVEGLEQQTAFIASENLAGQMGANTTNEKINLTPNMEKVEQKTQQIAVDKMIP